MKKMLVAILFTIGIINIYKNVYASEVKNDVIVKYEKQGQVIENSYLINENNEVIYKNDKDEISIKLTDNTNKNLKVIILEVKNDAYNWIFKKIENLNNIRVYYISFIDKTLVNIDDIVININLNCENEQFIFLNDKGEKITNLKGKDKFYIAIGNNYTNNNIEMLENNKVINNNIIYVILIMFLIILLVIIFYIKRRRKKYEKTK